MTAHGPQRFCEKFFFFSSKKKQSPATDVFSAPRIPRGRIIHPTTPPPGALPVKKKKTLALNWNRRHQSITSLEGASDCLGYVAVGREQNSRTGHVHRVVGFKLTLGLPKFSCGRPKKIHLVMASLNARFGGISCTSNCGCEGNVDRGTAPCF